LKDYNIKPKKNIFMNPQIRVFLKIAGIPAFMMISASVFAQSDTFRLENYKLPEIKFRSIDISGRAENTGDGQNIVFDSISADKNRNNILNGNLALNFRSFKSTRKIQRLQNFSISQNSNFWKNQTDSMKLESKDLNSYTNLHYSLTNRIYGRKNYFIETDLWTYGTNDLYKRKADTFYTNNKNSYFSLQIPLLVGKGRIEPVTKARQAVYIFDELSKENRLTRNPSEIEITEFSDFLALLDNERYFDSRLKKISDLEKIDSFLTEKKIISEKDMKYFAIVNDNLDFGSNIERNSGKRFSIGTSPQMSLTNSTNRRKIGDSVVYTYDLKIKNLGISGILIYEIERPVNLYWQNNFKIEFMYSYLSSDTKIDTTSFLEKGTLLSGGINYGWSYVPNTRTSISANFVARFDAPRVSAEKMDTVFSNKSFHFNPGISVNLQYYLTQRLRFYANTYFSYRYLESDNEYFNQRLFNFGNYDKYKTFNYTISLGFSYAIF
jgi:hypothetical protein